MQGPVGHNHQREAFQISTEGGSCDHQSSGRIVTCSNSYVVSYADTRIVQVPLLA